MKTNITIDIYSDTTCPWCYIGLKKLKDAINEFSNGDFKLIWRPFQLNPDIPLEDSYSSFLVQYYKLTMDIPAEIVVGKTILNKNSLEEWLSDKKGKKVKIINPQRGESKNILNLCIKNSKMILKNKIIKKIKKKEYIPKTLLELKDSLNMSIVPRRIEAFDNSNLCGEFAVAGMVCFVNGKP